MFFFLFVEMGTVLDHHSVIGTRLANGPVQTVPDFGNRNCLSGFIFFDKTSILWHCVAFQFIRWNSSLSKVFLLPLLLLRKFSRFQNQRQRFSQNTEDERDRLVVGGREGKLNFSRYITLSLTYNSTPRRLSHRSSENLAPDGSPVSTFFENVQPTCTLLRNDPFFYCAVDTGNTMLRKIVGKTIHIKINNLRSIQYAVLTSSSTNRNH